MVSRRRALAVLGGGAVVATAGAGVAWHELRPDPGPGPDAAPTATAGLLTRGIFASRACGRAVAWQLALPPGAAEGDPLPVALVLHGRGGDATDAFGKLQLDGFLAEVVSAGAPPFALASVDGGDHSCWHRRASGEDPQAVLLEEYLPLLAKRGLRTDLVPHVPDLAGTDFGPGGHTQGYWRATAAGLGAPPACGGLRFLGGALAVV